MAGLCEACSHVGAILFAIETAVRMRESVTCTQEKNKWMMPQHVKEVPYIRVSEMDFASSKTKHKQLVENDIIPNASLPSAINSQMAKSCSPTSQSEQLAFFKNIAACSTKPVILSLVPDYCESYIPKEPAGLPKPLTNLFNEDYIDLSLDELQVKCEAVTLNITEEEARNVELQTRNQSSSSVWFEQRSGRITASQLHAVCHTNPENPSKSLIKRICYPGAYKFSSAATRWGIEHELKARAQYELITYENHHSFGVSDSGLHINPKWPFMGATPDGIVYCKCCGKGVCEIKCPYSHRNTTICEAVSSKDFCLERNGTDYCLKKTHAYYYQVQMQMFITGTDYCDFIVWTLKDIFIQRILPDNTLCTNAITKGTHFFKNVVLKELYGKWYSRPVYSQDLSTMSELNDNDDGDVWCSCQQYIPDTTLIGCDNDNCKVQWYHMICLGLSAEPVGTWICPTCLESK